MLVTMETPRPRISSEERDQQRSKVYKAEKVLDGKTKKLPTTHDMESYVRKIQSRAVLVKRFGWALTRNIAVKDGRGRRKACGGSSYISMPLWSRTEWIVLHEVAHTVTIRLFGFNVSAHGWQYANIYLQLVKSMLGPEMHDLLKESFKKHRVRTSPKQKREKKEVTPELLERLAKARAARIKKPAPIAA